MNKETKILVMAAYKVVICCLYLGVIWHALNYPLNEGLGILITGCLFVRALQVLPKRFELAMTLAFLAVVGMTFNSEKFDIAFKAVSAIAFSYKAMVRYLRRTGVENDACEEAVNTASSSDGKDDED